MCQSGRICCSQCGVYMHDSGDEDGDYFFECCEDYDACLEQNFVNIHLIDYFVGICEKCYKKIIASKKQKQ